MPWVLTGYTAPNWTAEDTDATYFDSYYAIDDYVEDEEWSLTADPSGSWVLS